MTGIFGHGDLRLYLLSLLSEHPRHGYELIQALSERFGGTYSPSAGTIYPRLAKLEDEGLVTKTMDGRKTVYSITDTGRAELEDRRDELDSIENNVTDSLRVLADSLRTGVNEAMRSLRADLAAAARSSRPDPFRSYTDTSSGGREPDGSASENAGGESATADASATDGASDSSSDASSSEQQRRLNTEAIREVELALNGFRASVRVDLRKHAARAAVSRAAVAQFTSELKRIQAELKANLQG
ncbi:MAG: PadR family transcriptional regulator [Subtercola sp.]|nr:PadR family transcriptional regulator [Subtercola sp.]